MFKYISICAFFPLVIYYTSCAQSKTELPKEKVRQHRSGLSEAELKEAANSPVPRSMVRRIRQAGNGDILIASYIGVYRYDKKSFSNLTRTIEWPTFWDVLEDRSGNLWLASQDSGVYYLPAAQAGMPAGQAGFQHLTTKDWRGITSALHIYEERGGNIWFGANRYNPSTNSFRTFTTKDGFPSNNIRLLFEDSTGKLWFGAQGEDLFVYDRKTFTVLKNKDGRAFNNVWSVIEDRKGNIWFGAHGLWRYDPSTALGTRSGTFTKVSERNAYAIIQDKQGNIWTTGGGLRPDVWALSRYDAKSLYTEKPEVTEIMSQPGMLLGILEDAKGNIWFGSGSGVYRYDGKTITDFKSEKSQK